MSVPRRKRESKLEALLAFDETFCHETAETQRRDYAGILGVDEVGRGSIIGPVVAAAALFPTDLSDAQKTALALLDDSKAAHLNHEKRLNLAETLKSCCYWGIGEASKEEVETLNVAQASLLASHRAILHLGKQFPDCELKTYLVVVDGKLKIPGLPLGQRPCVKADSQSAAVAAASVLAKAYRDAMIILLAKDYPGYDWETNAGYPTPAHKRAIDTLGLTPLHRQTYQAVRMVLEQQTQLFKQTT